MKKLDLIPKIEKESSSDSVRQVRLLQSLGGRITRSSDRISELSNGLPYFFVEVTCDDGSQMGIPAYGDEAIALCREILTTMQPFLMVSSR